MATLANPNPSDELKASSLQAATQLVIHAMTIKPVPESLRHILGLVEQFGAEKAILSVAQSLLSEMRIYRW